MNVDKDAKYAKTHEWAKKDGDLFVIGISDYAQSLLKDIVFVELPTKGTEFKKGDKAADIESVKAVEELKTPISGEIVDVNSTLEDDDAELINTDPYGEGWFIKIKPTNPAEFDELLSSDDYEKYVDTLDN